MIKSRFSIQINYAFKNFNKICTDCRILKKTVEEMSLNFENSFENSDLLRFWSEKQIFILFISHRQVQMLSY